MTEITCFLHWNPHSQKMKLALFLLPLLCLAQGQPSAPMAQSSGPQISWIGAGVSLGSRAAFTAAFTVPVSTQRHLYEWTAADSTWSHGKRIDTGSAGFALDVWPMALGKNWELHALLIGTGNLSSTPTASVGSFSGSGSIAVTYKGHWTMNVVRRQPALCDKD